MITLPVGLAIVANHNIWAADWRVILTLIGWIAILAGIARMALPDQLKRVGEAMLKKSWITTAPPLLMALLGAFLSWQGYLT